MNIVFLNHRKKSAKNNNQKNILKTDKLFKLADFGLCTKVTKNKPFEFGVNQFLAPEIFSLGVDSAKVSL